MLFFRQRVEYTDGEIDLIPIRIAPPERELGFGNETVWRICQHDDRKEIGQISFRDGESVCVYYFGHIGYHIDPPWRGNGYAAKACRLILPAIRRSGLKTVVITCDPDNISSRKTCEKLGCRLERIVQVPDRVFDRYDISRVKCRYIWITDEMENRQQCSR